MTVPVDHTRRFVDLHTHSTASDGTVSPAELVRLADVAHLAAVALTDHDTVAGLAEARAAARGCPQLRFVPGVEVSAAYAPGVMHILALGIDDAHPAVAKLVGQFVDARNDRNPKIIAKLQELGLRIDMADVLAVATQLRSRGDSGIVSRMHMAEALRRKGCVASIQEAFERYIGSGAPAFVDKERLQPADVIAAIRAGGAPAVLAHPVQLRCEDDDHLERIVRSLVDVGLEGIEVYHSDHDDVQTRLYLELARRFGLLVTGGSDFHGTGKPHVRLGRPRVCLSAITGPWARSWLGAG